MIKYFIQNIKLITSTFKYVKQRWWKQCTEQRHRERKAFIFPLFVDILTLILVWCWPLPNCFCLCPLLISCSLNLPRQGVSRREHALPPWECLQREAGGTGCGGLQVSPLSLQHTQLHFEFPWRYLDGHCPSFLITSWAGSAWKDKVSPVHFPLVPLWFLLLSPSSEGKYFPWCVSPFYWRIFFWYLKEQGDANQVSALWEVGYILFLPLTAGLQSALGLWVWFSVWLNKM